MDHPAGGRAKGSSSVSQSVSSVVPNEVLWVDVGIFDEFLVGDVGFDLGENNFTCPFGDNLPCLLPKVAIGASNLLGSTLVKPINDIRTVW